MEPITGMKQLTTFGLTFVRGRSLDIASGEFQSEAGARTFARALLYDPELISMVITDPDDRTIAEWEREFSGGCTKLVQVPGQD